MAAQNSSCVFKSARKKKHRNRFDPCACVLAFALAVFVASFLRRLCVSCVKRLCKALIVLRALRCVETGFYGVTLQLGDARRSIDARRMNTTQYAGGGCCSGFLAQLRLMNMQRLCSPSQLLSAHWLSVRSLSQRHRALSVGVSLRCQRAFLDLTVFTVRVAVF